MAEPNEETKTCPECRETLKANVSLCRFCGYVFPVGKAAKSSLAGRTEQLAAEAQQQSRVADWVKLAWPLAIIAGLLVLFLPAIARRTRDPMATWEQALSQGRPRTSYDAEFEEMFSRGSAQQPQPVDIKVYEGVCLLNFPQPVNGLLQRAAVKLLAESVAVAYSSMRTTHGDDPDVTTIVYSMGKKLLTFEVKNGKVK
jgi:hypothetical protein